MGVYIKGIEMPKRCGNCKFCVNMNEYPFKACFMTYSGIPLGTDRLKNCPLIEISTPHGRLIDETTIQGALIAEAYKNDGKFQWGDTIKWTPSEVGEIISNNVPTILEAEE